MNKVKYFLLLLLAATMMVSCSSTDENLRAMVPDDAVGIVAIDVPSILKKGGMKSAQEGTVKIPDELKKIIDDGDPNIIADVVGNLPTSGFDFTSRYYIFLSPGIYKCVALIPLSNQEQAIKMVSKIASEKMKEVGGVNYASHLDYGFAIDGDVLLIGRFSNAVSPEAGAKAAADILDKSKPSILDNKEVAKVIDNKQGDVNAYINVKNLGSLIKSETRVNTLLGGIQAIELFAESGINAMTATISFDMSKKDGEIAKMKTQFICDKNGHYSQLYDNVVLAKADSAATVLQLVPGDELNTYLGLRVDGSKLAQMPQMKTLYELLESNALTRGLNFKDIFSSIDGPLVVGMGRAQVADFNLAVAMHTNNPGMITDQVLNVASARGQEPMDLDGEYYYEHGNQGIALGETDKAFYLRMVDFEARYSADDQLVFEYNLDKCVVTFLRYLKIGQNMEGTFNWGLTDKTNGGAIYFAENPKANVVISILKLLCWKEPKSTTDDSQG